MRPLLPVSGNDIDVVDTTLFENIVDLVSWVPCHNLAINLEDLVPESEPRQSSWGSLSDKTNEHTLADGSHAKSYTALCVLAQNQLQQTLTLLSTCKNIATNDRGSNIYYLIENWLRVSSMAHLNGLSSIKTLMKVCLI